MKFSIIMPAYNAEAYIDSAIESLVAQSYKNWELIVINDGSTDSTLEKLYSWQKIEKRIKIISQKNSGKPSIARNRAITKATGDYVCFLDADDIYDVCRLETCFQFFSQNPNITIWFSDFSTIDEQGTIIEEKYLKARLIEEKLAINQFGQVEEKSDEIYLLNNHFLDFMVTETTAIHTITICIKSETLLNTGLFNEELTVGEDLDLWFRLIYNYSSAFCKTPLSHYRINPNSITKDNEKMLLGTFLTHYQNLNRFKNDLSYNALLCYRLKISTYAENLAYYYRQKRKFSVGKRYYVIAFKLNPCIKNLYNIIKSYVPVTEIRSALK